MLIDLMSNEMSYNVKLANLIGVGNAIYVSALSKLMFKSIEDKTFENDCFKVDQKYIYKISGITPKDQINLDPKLEKYNIIKFNNLRDRITLNLDVIIDIISNKEIKKTTLDKILKDQKTTDKLSKRQIICNNLKKFIVCSNQELLDAYNGWVEGVYANPKGFLSERSIRIFQNTINDYTKGDLDIALKLIDIATVNGYRDATWAINKYEEQKPKQIKPKLNNQEKINQLNNNNETF